MQHLLFVCRYLFLLRASKANHSPFVMYSYNQPKAVNHLLRLIVWSVAARYHCLVLPVCVCACVCVSRHVLRCS